MNSVAYKDKIMQYYRHKQRKIYFTIFGNPSKVNIKSLSKVLNGRSSKFRADLNVKSINKTKAVVTSRQTFMSLETVIFELS